MPLKFDVDAPQLAALLCSKVCHDVISPVGALSMSLEMLDEPGSADDALDLVRKSTKSAVSTLQFCRLAFGASGSTGASIDTGDAEKVAVEHLADERTTLNWQVERMILPKNQVKLLLNLLLIAAAAIPRGGVIAVRSEGGQDAPGFTFHAAGKRVRVPVAFDEMVDGDIPEEGIDSQNVQAYYTMLLAHETGMPITVDLGDTDVTIKAGPPA